MKFGKEFASQVVQEWQGAYVDYNHLKDILKHILHFRRRNGSSPAKNGGLKRRISLYRAFSGLTSRYNSFKGSQRKNHEDEVILVQAVQLEGSPDGHRQYETMFLRSSDEGGETELMFFRKLDDEFNKVVEFYEEKVAEVMREADDLDKQMNALIALRVRVDNPSPEIASRTARMDAIQEVEMSGESSTEDGISPGSEPTIAYESRDGKHKPDSRFHNLASLRILDHVRVNIAPETPASTLRSIFVSSKMDLSFSQKELKKIEEQMKQAFIGFYQKLRLLKSYCFLNMLAFSKIMKKYDKITSRNASKAYLEMVDKSNLGSSDEISRLVERVEATFVKHFSNGNRRKGMNELRPKTKRERHRVTFFLGLFSGCAIALVVAVIVLLQARNLIESEGTDKYMENIFPLYSLFGYVVFHMNMYSANVYFWRRYRVNYPFIFGFKQGTELGYREVLLVSSGLSVLTLCAVISNLNMEMDPSTKSFETLTELVPLGLLVLVLLITFCPLNVIYRSSRYFLIRSVFHCICAPFYKVTLPDFFLADQFTSQVQALRSLQFYICYYVWGDFKTRSNKCSDNDTYKVFYIIIAVIPYWVRFIQCIRRLYEEKDFMQALNGLKYFSTIVAVVMRAGNDLKWGIAWRIMAAASSGIATVASTYWDIVIDWGLLQKDSRNPWLRDKLLVPNKSVYFVAIVSNILLRFAWMQSVLGVYDLPFLHRRALSAIIACLEILRRGIWNFFRLENEHLNNVGKYRAVKSVPLPFYYGHEDKAL